MISTNKRTILSGEKMAIFNENTWKLILNAELIQIEKQEGLFSTDVVLHFDNGYSLIFTDMGTSWVVKDQ